MNMLVTYMKAACIGLVLVCAPCTFAQDTNRFSATIQDSGAYCKLRWGHANYDGRYVMELLITDIDLTNRVVSIMQPMTKYGCSCHVTVMRSDPKLLATVTHLPSGDTCTSGITTWVKHLLPLGGKRYQIVDIRPKKAAVVVKEFPDGKPMTVYCTQPKKATPRKDTEQAESTVPSKAAPSASPDVR